MSQHTDIEQCVRDERWDRDWALRFKSGKWWVLNIDSRRDIAGGHPTILAAAQAALSKGTP